MHGTSCVARRGKWWAPDLKLTKKVTTDEEGAGPLLLRIVAEKFQRPTPEDSTCCLLTSRLTVTLEVVQVVQRWHRLEERPNHTTPTVENEVRTIIERSHREPGRERQG